MIFQATILDQELNPIPRANVVVLDFIDQPTTTGNDTDENGKTTIYSLAMTAKTKIRISALGYATVIDTVENLNFKTIQLKDEVFNLPEIEVTNKKTGGYIGWLLLGAGIIAAVKATRKKRKTVTAKI